MKRMLGGQGQWVTRIVLTGCLALLHAGCDAITGASDKERASVQVRPLGPGDSVSLVTSSSFSVDASGQVALLTADTQRIRLPFDRDYPLDRLDRFFVEVGPAFDGDTTSVHMEVQIDDRDWFSQQLTLGHDGTGVLTFVYRFSVPRF